jgi:hypothetical protein
MTNQHPITPLPELVHQWADMLSSRSDQVVFSLAARWGADQELEACCEWLEDADLDDSQKVSWVNLRTARRPKPPTLKEQALEALELVQKRTTDPNIIEPIRRALEALPDELQSQ